MNRPLPPLNPRAILAVSLAATIPLCIPSARADTFSYNGTASDTVGSADTFSSGNNWTDVTTGAANAAPASDPTTVLNFGAVLPGASTAATLFVDNDVASPFVLNALNFSYGSLNSLGANLTLEDTTGPNDSYEFISNGATTPTLTLNATGPGPLPTLTIAEPVTFANTLTVTGTSNGSVTAVISGAGGLTLGTAGGTGASVFSGVLTLTAANTFTGATTLNSGILNVQSAAGLGPTSTTVTTTIASGATLQLAGAGFTLASKPLSISGSGASGTTGALESVSGANAYAGAVTLAGAATISSDVSGVVLTLSGPINGAGNTVSFAGAGTVTASGVISGTGTGVTRAGSGILNLTGANTYTGATTINSGEIGVSGSGSIPSTSVLTVGNLNTGGGVFSYQKAGTQTFASTSINGPANFIVNTNAGGIINLNAITRTTGSTIDFGGSVSSGVASITGTITTSNTTNTNGIMGGYATIASTAGVGGTWAVAPSGAGGAITPFPNSAYTTTAANGNASANYAATQNIDVTSSQTLDGAINVNSLRFNTAAVETLTLATGSVNTITTGGILITAGTSTASVITGGSLAAANGELFVTNGTAGGQNFTIASAIIDNGTSTSLTKGGFGNLALTGANTYTGMTVLGQGLFQFNSIGNVGGTTPTALGEPQTTANGTIYLENGGGFQYAGTTVATSNRPIVLGAPNSTRNQAAGTNTINGSSGALILTGGITGTNSILQFGGQTAAITETGNVSLGLGGVTVIGEVDTLAGTDTYSGTTLINSASAVLIISGTNNSTGPVTITTGTLQIGAGGTTGTFLGPGSVTDNGTFAVNRSNAAVQGTAFGLIAGTGGFTQAGTGTTTLTGFNTYTGVTKVTGGTLQVGNGTSGTIAGPTASALTFAGTGTFNVQGVTTGSTQTMGALTFTAGDGTVESTYGGTSGTTTLTPASLAARAVGATGNFVINGGANGSTNLITFATPPTLVNGIINQGAFFGGSGYATYASGYVQADSAALDTNYAVVSSGTIASSATSNVVLGASVTGQPAASVNTLNLGANSLTLGSAVAFQTNGFLNTGGASAISGGTALTATAASASSDLVIRSNLSTDSLTISTPITNNGSTAIPVTYSGAGTVILTGTNTYTGATYIDGTLQLGNGGTTGKLGGGTGVNVVDNGTLIFNRSNAVAQGTDFTSNTIGGFGGITQAGTGTTTLTAANTYSGPTSVTAGTLLVNGAQTGVNGAVTVGSAGTLGGTGTLASATTVNGTITGGTKGTVGMLTLTNSVTLNSGSVDYVDISGATSDKLAIYGTLLSNGATLTFNGTPVSGDTYVLATYVSDTGSTFTETLPSGFTLLDTGTALELVPVTPVPEPGTFVLPSLLSGWLLLGMARRRLRASPRTA